MAVLIVTLILWLLPAEIWLENWFSAGDSFSEETACNALSVTKNLPEFFTGKIWKLEKSSSGQAVYLNHTNFFTTGSRSKPF